ncbi:MAG: GNAT family N-acetyltransferase [Rhizobiales bacterium]|nr:GNAT family N-acetyltransferase [Hyphomicrobiales bacterium]
MTIDPELTIRSATAEDAAAIFSITRASVAGLAVNHYSPQQISGWMGDRTPESYLEGASSGRIKIAELSGRAVGYVDAIPGEITRLFLLPEFSGRGIGKRLIDVGIEMARVGHSGPLRVEATRNAEAFYEHSGFRRVRAGVFAGRGGEWPPIETVIMSREA